MKRRTPDELDRLRERIEARKRRGLPAYGATLQLLPNESLEQAHGRAAAGGRQGPFLLMPPEQTPEQWAASCAAYQERLLHVGQRVAEGADWQDASQVLRQAYREATEAAGASPMP